MQIGLILCRKIKAIKADLSIINLKKNYQLKDQQAEVNTEEPYLKLHLHMLSILKLSSQINRSKDQSVLEGLITTIIVEILRHKWALTLKFMKNISNACSKETIQSNVAVEILLNFNKSLFAILQIRVAYMWGRLHVHQYQLIESKNEGHSMLLLALGGHRILLNRVRSIVKPLNVKIQITIKVTLIEEEEKCYCKTQYYQMTRKTNNYL